MSLHLYSIDKYKVEYVDNMLTLLKSLTSVKQNTCSICRSMWQAAPSVHISCYMWKHPTIRRIFIAIEMWLNSQLLSLVKLPAVRVVEEFCVQLQVTLTFVFVFYLQTRSGGILYMYTFTQVGRGSEYLQVDYCRLDLTRLNSCFTIECSLFATQTLSSNMTSNTHIL